MLRPGLVRRAAYTIARTSAAGTIGAASAFLIYTNTEQGLGAKRQFDFWRSVTPVVFDYWWNVNRSSPKVKLQTALTKDGLTEEENATNRKQLFQSLHERNAQKIFNIMIDLGGLYIKLGQVLSVTVLPIPELYRSYFRTLQSNVPTHEEFEKVVKPTLEKELGMPLGEIFESVDETPCGAASIGQAHRATLKNGGEKVIIKVQYPDAKWQVPADVECVGKFLKLCVFFGVVDESASQLSYDEFARQFLAELDYAKEKENLQEVYQSSLDPEGPYAKRGVVIPRVFNDLCTNQLITMTYLPGRKFEEEAKQQLKLLGVDTNKGLKSVVKSAALDTQNSGSETTNAKHGEFGDTAALAFSPKNDSSWRNTLTRVFGQFVRVDSIFVVARFARTITTLSTALAVKSIQAASSLAIVPSDWESWANERQHAVRQAEHLGWTQNAVDALLDVHGYQIFNQGLFNADPHPGNILLVEDDENPKQSPKIGLIDYGQCKRLTVEERVKIAKMMLSVANKESDEKLANHLRDLGFKTKNDSTRFLAEFGRLMFDSLQSKHLDKKWHQELHEEDKILYFPKELSMVYRATLLLRGLAVSLQSNPSIGEQWRHHAQAVVDKYDVSL